jgi:sugar-specific transcriptional regulator TrmB
MKTSHLLNILVASLKNITKVIAKSQHNTFVVELVIGNYRSIYDDLCRMTDKGAEDEFVTRNFREDYFAKKMDYYAQNKNIFTREQYIAEVRQLIDKTIDNAARLGFGIEPDDDTDDDTPDTTDDGKTPPQPSNNNAQLIKLLRDIIRNLDKVIKILEK